MGRKQNEEQQGRGWRRWRRARRPRRAARPQTEAGSQAGQAPEAPPRRRPVWRSALRDPLADMLSSGWAATRATVREGREAVTGMGPGSWRRTARQAGDLPSLRRAFAELARTAPELILGRGPEPSPPPVPPTRWRLVRWWRRFPAQVLWLAAFAMFSVNVAFLQDNTWLGDPSWVAGLAVLPVSLLMALPLGLAAHTPLRAWRLTILVGALSPVVVPLSAEQGAPWSPVQVFVALYVLYAVAVRLELSRLVGVWLLTSATILWSYLAADRQEPVGSANATIILLTILLALGYLISTRRRLQHEVVEGEQRTREEQERRALLEERARIARELHDVVAHHMSVIAVRAETAPFRIPDLSQAGREDMAETSAIARQALGEMRRLLGVLRGADTGVERAPQPGLDRLDQLVAGVRRAGVSVSTSVVGAERPLPQGVELSAYRIVQEALSNVLRHAPGARATVEIAYEPAALRLRIENDASPDRREDGRPSGHGHGIIGMRERATMLGGKLEVGPTPAGGFRVEAVLPLDEQPPGSPRSGPPPGPDQRPGQAQDADQADAGQQADADEDP